MPDKSVLTNFLDSLEKNGIPGCSVVVYHDHEVIFRHVTGYADAEKARPLTYDNTFFLYSTSKLITCTAILQLAESGKLNIDDPVRAYLPEYGALKVKHGTEIEDAKTPMTIRHLLAMQSGLNYNLEAPSILKALKETDCSTREIIRALANEPLDFEPGTRFQYSLSHDVLGAIIEVASGMKFSSYLNEHIFAPLGMKHTGFELTPDCKAQLSGQFEYHADSKTSTPIPATNPFVFAENYESGGAGLISTLDDYALFLDAMCNNGLSANGHRILTADSINAMRKDQLHDKITREDFSVHGKIGYGYGLGVRTLIEKEKSGAKSPIGEFGWDGAAGAYALIDTENRLAIFYLQHIMSCGYVYETIQPNIRDIVYETLL